MTFNPIIVPDLDPRTLEMYEYPVRTAYSTRHGVSGLRKPNTPLIRSI